MAQIKTKGLVLRERGFREQGKIVTIFTEDCGKIQGIVQNVKGGRNSNSVATQVFTYSEFIYFPGKNMVTINHAEIIETFYDLRYDIYKMTMGSYILELMDTFYDYHQGDKAVLRLAVFILFYLSKNMSKRDEALVVAFQMKLSEVQGVMPILDECVICKSKEGLTGFSIEKKGAICSSCKKSAGYNYKVTKEALQVMKYLLETPINQVRGMEFDRKTLKSIIYLMNDFFTEINNHSYKAIKFFEELQAK